MNDVEAMKNEGTTDSGHGHDQTVVEKTASRVVVATSTITIECVPGNLSNTLKTSVLRGLKMANCQN